MCLSRLNEINGDCKKILLEQGSYTSLTHPPKTHSIHTLDMLTKRYNNKKRVAFRTKGELECMFLHVVFYHKQKHMTFLYDPRSMILFVNVSCPSIQSTVMQTVTSVHVLGEICFVVERLVSTKWMKRILSLYLFTYKAHSAIRRTLNFRRQF